MKQIIRILIPLLIISSSCTTQKDLAYLNNLPEAGGGELFEVEVPDYRIQPRDILNITIKAMTPDGSINDFLSSLSRAGGSYTQTEAGQYIYGYDVNSDGNIILPVLGVLKISGLTLDEARMLIQESSDMHFNNSTVECKLLSFKFTVIGEVRTPGTFINYNNYLTVFEAIGRAGGISDYGRRDRITVIRPVENGARTYTLNLQDKSIITSDAYFLLPNDVIIVEPQGKKIFNLNLPAFSFIVTSVASLITSTLLLINYFGGK